MFSSLSQEQIQQDLSQAREQKSAAESKTDVLDDLERKQEGVGAGVRQIQQIPASQTVLLGMLADGLEVDMEHAPLVDQVLEGKSQTLIANFTMLSSKT